MKPRRLVRATTFSVSCPRATVKTWTTPTPAPQAAPDLPARRGGELIHSCLLEDRQDVAGRVFEPRDVRASIVGEASCDSLVVGDPRVVLELDALSGQLVESLVDVVDGKIEDGVRRGLVIVLRGDKDPVADFQPETRRNLLELHAQRVSVVGFCRHQVVDSTAAECLLY